MLCDLTDPNCDERTVKTMKNAFWKHAIAASVISGTIAANVALSACKQGCFNVSYWGHKSNSTDVFCLHYPDGAFGHAGTSANRDPDGKLKKPTPTVKVNQVYCVSCVATCAINQIPQEVGAGTCNSKSPKERDFQKCEVPVVVEE